MTRFGKPIAEIVPVSPDAGPAEWIGSLKGTAEILGDIVAPASDPEEWEALRNGSPS